MESNPTAFVSPQEEEERQERSRAAAVRALRGLVSRHNWHALTLAFFSFVTAATLWGLVYLFAYWFDLIATTVSRGLNQDTLFEINDPGMVSSRFPWFFLLGASLTLSVAALARRKVRLERLREAQHYLLWVIVELLMAIPNVTFSVWGNLSAIVQLSAWEAENAWNLLQRINHEGGRLNVASLRLEIEDEEVLEHVVFILQIVGLTDMRERREGWFLCLQNRDAFSLLTRAAAA